MTGPNYNPKTHQTLLPPTAAQCNPWGISIERKSGQTCSGRAWAAPNTPSTHPGPVSLQTITFPHTELPHDPQDEEMAAILLPMDEKLPPSPKKLKLWLQTLHLFSSKDGQNISGYSEVGIKSLGIEYWKIRVKPNLCQSCTSKRPLKLPWARNKIKEPLVSRHDIRQELFKILILKQYEFSRGTTELQD